MIFLQQNHPGVSLVDCPNNMRHQVASHRFTYYETFSTSMRKGAKHAWNTKGGSITVLLTSCLTCLDQSVLQLKTKIVSCHTADSKPVKQEVNVTVILPPLVFPGLILSTVSQKVFKQKVQF